MKNVLNLLFLATFLMSCNKEIEPITENDWVVIGFKRDADAISKKPEIDYTFTFESKKQLSVRLDINLCGSEIKFKKNNILEVSGFGCTEACCDSEMAVMMISHLQGENTYTLIGNRLDIRTREGSVIQLETKK